MGYSERRPLVVIWTILIVVGVLWQALPTKGNETLQKVEAETKTMAEPEDEQTMETYQVNNPADMKAMWLSQFDMTQLYCQGDRQRDETSFRQLLLVMLERVRDLGINTVIVQVRPYADSFYPSELYPMSKYVVGQYGNLPEYDPFAIVVEAAHSFGLSVHAWINPLRGMLERDIGYVPRGYAIRDWYEDSIRRGKYVVSHGDGRVYLNPAYQEVRELIVAGAREILRRYDVDGLHMDDYFYPSGCQDEFDQAAFDENRRAGGTQDRMTFRRAQINALVRELYRMVKSENPSVLFGISPGGNTQTNYEKLGADVAVWCGEPGYLDYICPQVYWGMEHETYDFVSVCATFDDMIQVDGIRLIIGMTVSKAKTGYDKYAGSGAWEWSQHKDVLYRCLTHTGTLKHCGGVSYFCYQYFYDPLTGVSVPETEAEREAFLPVLKTISWNGNTTYH